MEGVNTKEPCVYFYSQFKKSNSTELAFLPLSTRHKNLSGEAGKGKEKSCVPWKLKAFSRTFSPFFIGGSETEEKVENFSIPRLAFYQEQEERENKG